jgi:hypothetical protein
LEIPGWNDEVVDKPELDGLRRYVRRGSPRITWPIHIRRIYPQDFVFPDTQHGPHQVLHEWDILCTQGEYYVVLAIFGVEYVINLGGPELDGFNVWLKKHNDHSPLYAPQDT